MLMVLSPAKTLDYTTPPHTKRYTEPGFLADSQQLITVLREKSPADIAKLMDISDALATLNVGRYHDWNPVFTPDNAKQAVLAFLGDVYEGLDAASLNETQLDYLQHHLRILSGLYGLLRPLDLMQPYRLEMGTRLANPRGANLYAFWGERITDALNTLLDGSDNPVLVNLASDEYFKSVKPAKLHGRLITPVFQDYKNGQYKIISFYAKQARGLMARWAALHQADIPEALQDFNLAGYQFDSSESDTQRWVFRRRAE
ncbi:peroxide stress protein YaaA [Aquitalea sp. LB_tupeE]|uniref:peroxide stress protein YaaA n=1 Tax=Aquitalea sp. LB_tupeE TaxID=2748078 RepID=UPI0015BEE942|nr:peroxide stress protein YaaA [Aquitalea sp. LB_tupeE]NWK76841.1 peroxide stress protein YaaA [Aquitalea sp. LB_tupeE]